MLKFFISYNNKDEHFAEELNNQLKSVRLDSFFAPFDNRPGEKWRKQIKKHLENSDGFILIWSLAASKSLGVADEVRQVAESKQEKSILIVRTDDTPLPATLSEFHSLSHSEGEDINEVLKGLLRTTVKRVEEGHKSVERGKVYTTILSLILISILVALLYMAYSYGFLHKKNSRLLNTMLEYHDPSIFDDNSPYYVARVFSDRDDLLTKGGLGDVFENTKCTFDLISLSAGSLSKSGFHRPMKEAIERGVEVRVIILDSSSTALELITKTQSRTLKNERSNISNRVVEFEEYKSFAESKDGSFSYKLSDQQLLWAGWVKDAECDTEGNTPVSHLSFYTYSRGEGLDDPSSVEISTRFGKVGSDVTTTVQNEFNYLWDKLGRLPSEIADIN